MTLWERLVYEFSETKWNMYLSFTVDVLVSTFLVAYVLLNYTVSVSGVITALLGGWFLFTFVEYAVHAWLFHIGQNIFVKGHAKHHRNPQGFDNLPFFAASLIGVVIFFISSQFIEEPYAILLSAAALFGYFMYGIYHFLMHRIDFTNPYGKYMQRFHYVHHMRPKKNHGVTVPYWDVIFNTYESLKKYDFNKNLKLRPDEKLIKE